MFTSFRRPALLSSVAFVLVLSACEGGGALIPIEDWVTVPPVVVNTSPIAVSAVSTQIVIPFGPIVMFDPAKRADLDLGKAITAGITPQDNPTPIADTNSAALVAAIANASNQKQTAVVSITGHADNQRQFIDSAESMQLAKARAWKAATDLQVDLVAAGVANSIIVRSNAECTVYPGMVCIVAEVPREAAGTIYTGQRSANAKLTLSASTVGITGTTVPSTETTTAPTTAPTTETTITPGGSPTISATTVPSATPVPATVPGMNYNPGSSTTTTTTTPPNVNNPVDITVDNILQTLSVRVEVSVPDRFYAKGAYLWQSFSVTSVTLYCNSTPCNNPTSPSLTSFVAVLSLPSSNPTIYKPCATVNSTNCGFFINPNSIRATSLIGDTLSANALTTAFYTPTLSASYVHPTVSTLRASVKIWLGTTPSCGLLPQQDVCWTESTPLPSSVFQVYTSNGVPFINNSYVVRNVVGSKGSNQFS